MKQSNCNKCVNVPATYNIWLMENLVVVTYHLLLDVTGMGENRVANTIFGIQQQLPSKVQSDLEPSTIFNSCMIRSKACTKPFFSNKTLDELCNIVRIENSIQLCYISDICLLSHVIGVAYCRHAMFIWGLIVIDGFGDYIAPKLMAKTKLACTGQAFRDIL